MPKFHGREFFKIRQNLDPVKVVITNHGIYPDNVGGMERHTFNLAKFLSAHCQVEVLVPEPYKGTAYPFSVHHLPWPDRPLWLWSNYTFSEAVGQWIERHRPDIAFGQGFNLWAYLSRKQLPCIFHPHGLDMYGEALRGREKLTAIPFRHIVSYHAQHSDVTLSLGGKLTTILLDRVKVPRQRVIEIPNAIDLDEYEPLETKKKEFSFLFVGRLAFNKGIDLIESVLTRTRDLSYTLTMVGDGPFRSTVERLAKQDPRVRYKGEMMKDELRLEYAQHEALIFASRFEGMPTVVLEAMASTCAVIATRIGAVETMVGNRTGILCEPDAKSLETALRTYCSMSLSARARLGENGRQLVEEKFTWQKVTPLYLDLFHRLMG
jgi:glycosyltransferase involved in cell wall biosynthesis